MPINSNELAARYFKMFGNHSNCKLQYSRLKLGTSLVDGTEELLSMDEDGGLTKTYNSSMQHINTYNSVTKEDHNSLS